MIEEDPLEKLYEPLPEIKPLTEKIALLIIDVSYIDAGKGCGLVEQAEKAGISEAAKYYCDRVQNKLVPNIQRLQKFCRDNGIEVIFTKNESLTEDGRDRSLEYKILGFNAPKGSEEGKILEEIGPEGDEIVIPKTASSVFNATNIDYVLRNLGIDTLIIGGVVTNHCVETSVRDAVDRSYNVVVVKDCCAALSENYHEYSLKSMKHIYARIRSTDEVINWLKSGL